MESWGSAKRQKFLGENGVWKAKASDFQSLALPTELSGQVLLNPELTSIPSVVSPLPSVPSRAKSYWFYPW